MDIYKSIGKAIKQKRVQLELSQEDLANLLGISPAAVSMYELGERKPELHMLQKISSTLSIPLAQLIEIEVPQNNLDIALRSEKLDQDDIQQVKSYISTLKYAKRAQQDVKANRMQARKKAKEVLQKLSIENPPVKIADVIKLFEIDAIKGDEGLSIFKKISAFIDLEDKIIVYKDSDPVVRKRFSIAHEIGHFLMNHSIKNDIFNMDSNDYREIEANMFAAELLMPFEWVKSDMQDHNLSIKELSRKYWVSEEAMGWRLFKSDALLLS